MAVVGLSPALYWRSSFSDVVEYIRTFNRLEEQRQKNEWERTRWQTAVLLNVHVKKGRQLRPKDLLPFPWEEAEQVKPKILTKEEKFEEFNAWDRDMRQLFEKQKTVNGI